MRCTSAVVGLFFFVACCCSQAANGAVVKVSPSKTPINVGDCLYFTGTVTQDGKPVKGANVGVEDPIREQSIGKAAVTDSAGKFTYYTEDMCPAKYDCKVGTFKFTFFASGASAAATVVVKSVQPSGYRGISVNNTSTKAYKVRVLVDGADKGTFTVIGGKSLNLFQDKSFKTSTLSAYVMDSTGKNLWNATYNWTPTFTPSSSTFLNPAYSNYKYASTTKAKTSKKDFNFDATALAVNPNVFNGQIAVGSAQVNVVDGNWHGINYNAGGSVSGPNVATFLGLKASCSLDCGVSAGLQLCLGGGAGWAIGPAKLGCTANCCVTVASASASWASAEVSTSASVK
jgi:hypothetical protein